jgi:hypothetical protein
MQKVTENSVVQIRTCKNTCKTDFTHRVKKRADNLLRLSRHQLRMVIAILAGHAPVRRHLNIMGRFKGDPTCRFCRKETETVQHIICCCEALAHQCYNVFGNPFVEPKVISTASVRDLCLFIRGTGLLNLC